MVFPRTRLGGAAGIAVVALAASCRPVGPPPVVDPALADCIPSDVLAVAGVNLDLLRASALYGRLGPAAALFRLAAANLGDYPPEHERLDLKAVRRMIVEWLRWLEEAEFAANPLATHAAPRLGLRAGC